MAHTILRGEEALIYAEKFGVEVVMSSTLKCSAASARKILAATEDRRPEERAQQLQSVVATIQGKP